MIFLALIGFALISAITVFLVSKLYQISNKKKLKGSRNKSNKKNFRTERKLFEQQEKFSCAFFHPNCSAGGGGERTLFAALISVKSNFPQAQLYLYIKGGVQNQSSWAEIKRKAKDDFNFSLPDDIKLIPLKSVFLAESYFWARFTLIGQIIGSIVLGIETIIRFRPDVLIDTAGFSFIYPIIKLFNTKLIAYVHYPFISCDMIQKLQIKSYNNSGLVANNSIIRNLKVFYYRKLLNIYSYCGKCCNLAFTNSTWTNGHILRSWINCPNIKLLYPPCDLNPFISQISLERNNSQIQVLSLSQFRPEKNHKLQLDIAALVLKKLPSIQFIFIGGSRGREDEERVNILKEYANELGISESIKFKLNLPFNDLLNTLQNATIGIHTMIEEHFGIGIVELMASGLITIANDSGGPRADIIKKDIGFLSSTASDYSEAIIKIALMSQSERLNISSRARKNVIDRFSGEIFYKKFSKNLKEII